MKVDTPVRITSRFLLGLAMLITGAVLLFLSITAYAGQRIKLGTIAPRGSIYHQKLEEIGQAWRRVEGNNAQFIVYTDGSQGSEADVVRRIRIGQLDAALISTNELSKIDKMISALQKIPLLYESWDEFDYVRDYMQPILEKRFRDKGFIILLWTEVGWVRFFSATKAIHPDDYLSRKIFAWVGDREHLSTMNAMGYHPVVLESTDMLSALQTGLINVVPTIPMFALSAQIDISAPHMLDMKWAPIAAAVIISRKKWDQLSPAGREALRNASQKVSIELRPERERFDREAIAAMQQRGLKVHSLDAPSRVAWQQVKQRAYVLIRGKQVPEDTFDQTIRLIEKYRREIRR